MPPAAEASPPDPRFITTTYCNNYIKFGLRIINIILKKSKITTENVLIFASSVLLHLIFTSNSVVFVDGRRKNISCPRAQGTLATPLW